MLKQAFDPVVDANTRLLILGSLPGDASLKAGQYYGHPRNAFWPLVGGVIGYPDLKAQSYEARLDQLRAHGIGLWDVIAHAERRGSLDADIRNAEAADLKRVVLGLPGLRAIAFNGGTAARVGRRILSDSPVPELIDLPSSSPAHAALGFTQKAEAWSILRGALED